MAINFTLESSDRDGDDHYVHLQVSGEGDLEHYAEAFTAFLLARGFHPDTVAALMPNCEDIGNYREDVLLSMEAEAERGRRE